MTDQTVSLLQLVKRKDADNTDVNTVDFLALPTELQYQGWNQGLPQPNMPSVDESITLLMNAGNANTLATALQSIDTKIKEIGWAQDPLNPIGVWLRAQLTGETNSRQCFILAAKRPPRGLEITNPLAYSNVIPNYNLGLTRVTKWENLVKTDIPDTPTDISIHGGTISYTNAGDAHARVAQLFFDGTRNNFSSFYHVWAGVKSNRYGVNPANFVPTWNLSDGTIPTGSDTSTAAAAGNGGALSGTKLVCTFATHTDMISRAFMTVAQAQTDASKQSDQRGHYTVLLRAAVSDPSLIVNVRIGQGFLYGTPGPSAVVTSAAYKPRTQITSAITNGWQYVALGQVTLPSSGGFSDLTMSNSCLIVQAEYVSGTGDLELDSLVLIPAEHTVHVNPPHGAVGSGLALYIMTRPDGRLLSFSYKTSSSLTFESMTPDAIDWSIPSGSGVIVFAATNFITTVDDTITPTLSTYPSYNSLRGSA